MAGLAQQDCGPEDDGLLLGNGIGFTDVVKRSTRGSGDLTARDFRSGVPDLKEKLLHFQPKVVCFHGVTAYGSYLRYAESIRKPPNLGIQLRAIGQSRVFVTPNPSPANAAVSLDTLVSWYVRLRELVEITTRHE